MQRLERTDAMAYDESRGRRNSRLEPNMLVVLLRAPIFAERARSDANDALRCALERPAACRLHEPTEFAVPRSPLVDGHVRASTLIQDSLLPHPPPLFFRPPSTLFVSQRCFRVYLPLFPPSVSVFPRAPLYLNANGARLSMFDL